MPNTATVQLRNLNSTLPPPTFTIARRPVSPAFADAVPYVVALVTLDEGPTMMSNIVGIDVEKVEIGMPVTVTFDDWSEEIAIAKFKPA